MTVRLKRLIPLGLILVLALVLWSGCSSEDSDHSAKTKDMQPYDSIVIELPGKDSMSVLEVTDAAHDIDARTSAMGSFVIQIDTIRNSPGFFWVCSVNGEMIDVAADKYITRTGDVVRWHYRRFGGR
jgi:hypothetical protein